MGIYLYQNKRISLKERYCDDHQIVSIHFVEKNLMILSSERKKGIKIIDRKLKKVLYKLNYECLGKRVFNSICINENLFIKTT